VTLAAEQSGGRPQRRVSRSRRNCDHRRRRTRTAHPPPRRCRVFARPGSAAFRSDRSPESGRTRRLMPRVRQRPFHEEGAASMTHRPGSDLHQPLRLPGASQRKYLSRDLEATRPAGGVPPRRPSRVPPETSVSVLDRSGIGTANPLMTGSPAGTESGGRQPQGRAPPSTTAGNRAAADLPVASASFATWSHSDPTDTGGAGRARPMRWTCPRGGRLNLTSSLRQGLRGPATSFNDDLVPSGRSSIVEAPSSHPRRPTPGQQPGPRTGW